MIRAGVLLGSALLALSGCASSARRPVTVGAQVVPTRTGFEFYRRGSVNTWHVYDYDGTSRVLTLEDPLGSFGAAVRQFNACVCSQCQALPSAYSASDPGSTRARPPELLKHVHECAIAARLTDLRELPGPDATEYRLTLVVGDAARYMEAGEVLLWHPLGSRRNVTTSTAAGKAALVTDVNNCVRSASAAGTIDDCGSKGFQCQSVQSMLDRFDACLRSRSYTVEPESTSGPSASKE